MKLLFFNNRYEFICTYDQKHIPKEAGCRWDTNTKRWWTNKIEVAQRLAKYADDPTRKQIQDSLNLKEANIKESEATNSDLEIPCPEGLEYMPFQRAGIEYALKRETTLLTDEMGLGKSIQAIGVINMVQPNKVLIVCPATLKLNWKKECEKWLVNKMSIAIINREFETAQIVIVNYDIISKFEQQIKNIEWDFLICDEAHYMKNSKAKRTKMVLGHKTAEKEILPIKAKKKLFLTGTPILNRPAELWTLCHALDPQTFSSWKYFMTRYADGHQTRYGWDISGASNLDELQEKLRSTIMIRRLKKDVLKELPSKRRQVIEISANGCSRIVERERAEYEKYQNELDELKLQVELAKSLDNEEEYKEAVRNLKACVHATFTEIAKIRHETALAKVPHIIEHLNDIIESDETQKIVVFAYHLDVIEKLRESFSDKCVVLIGETFLVDRQLAVDRFQNDSKIKLFIGNIKAAGVGITLTASSLVMFAELDYVPANMSQAEDRLHRIGQQESVLVQHLVLEGSLDADIAQTLIEKQSIIERALDGEIDVDIALPEKVKGSTQTISFKQVQKEASEMANEVMQKIHFVLKQLSFVCDGAVSLDSNGFNKLDSAIGHSLANCERLTPKQAVLGKRIIGKYKRQIDPIIYGEIFSKERCC